MQSIFMQFFFVATVPAGQRGNIREPFFWPNKTFQSLSLFLSLPNKPIVHCYWSIRFGARADGDHTRSESTTLWLPTHCRSGRWLHFAFCIFVQFPVNSLSLSLSYPPSRGYSVSTRVCLFCSLVALCMRMSVHFHWQYTHTRALCALFSRPLLGSWTKNI